MSSESSNSVPQPERWELEQEITTLRTALTAAKRDAKQVRKQWNEREPQLLAAERDLAQAKDCLTEIRALLPKEWECNEIVWCVRKLVKAQNDWLEQEKDKATLSSALEYAKSDLTRERERAEKAEAERDNYKRAVTNAHRYMDDSSVIKSRDVTHQGLTPRVRSILARLAATESARKRAVEALSKILAECDDCTMSYHISPQAFKRADQALAAQQEETIMERGK